MPKTCKNNALVEYCSYKGLTQKDILQCYHDISYVEYCSYKGLTLAHQS